MAATMLKTREIDVIISADTKTPYDFFVEGNFPDGPKEDIGCGVGTIKSFMLRYTLGLDGKVRLSKIPGTAFIRTTIVADETTCDVVVYDTREVPCIDLRDLMKKLYQIDSWKEYGSNTIYVCVDICKTNVEKRKSNITRAFAKDFGNKVANILSNMYELPYSQIENDLDANASTVVSVFADAEDVDNWVVV